MTKKAKRYSEEFKAEAVKAIENNGGIKEFEHYYRQKNISLKKKDHHTKGVWLFGLSKPIKPHTRHSNNDRSG